MLRRDWLKLVGGVIKGDVTRRNLCHGISCRKVLAQRFTLSNDETRYAPTLFTCRGTMYRRIFLNSLTPHVSTWTWETRQTTSSLPYMHCNILWIFCSSFCQTSITWLRSLSVILPLFWRHDIANVHTFAAKTWELLLWRHEIHGVSPRNWANALQNLQFFHNFTVKFYILSLNLTGDSDFFNYIY